MLAWASKLAEAGFIALVGRYKPAPMAPGRIECDDCPLAHEGVAALLSLAHRLPRARTGSVGILGLSGGAAEALRAARRSDVQAVVADSGTPAAEDPLRVRAAVLLLGFTQENATPGLQFYERTLRIAGRQVEAHMYEGAFHVSTLDARIGEDATARALDFLRRHLE
jgi:dienelactone hydrolase